MAVRFESPLHLLRSQWDARAAADPLRASCPEQEHWTPETFLAAGRALLAARVAPELPDLAAALRTPAGAFRVLDLGCGAGRTVGPLRELCGEVHAVDVSPRMLARARELAAATAGDGVGYFTSDGLSLQCVNRRSYHLAVCVDVLGHQPDDAFVRYLLGQVRDKLVPGGMLLADLPGAWAGGRVERVLGMVALETVRTDAEGARTWRWLRRPPGSGA
jgi:SAM-dependent methyltransferase